MIIAVVCSTAADWILHAMLSRAASPTPTFYTPRAVDIQVDSIQNVGLGSSRLEASIGFPPLAAPGTQWTVQQRPVSPAADSDSHTVQSQDEYTSRTSMTLLHHRIETRERKMTQTFGKHARSVQAVHSHKKCWQASSLSPSDQMGQTAACLPCTTDAIGRMYHERDVAHAAQRANGTPSDGWYTV